MNKLPQLGGLLFILLSLLGCAVNKPSIYDNQSPKKSFDYVIVLGPNAEKLASSAYTITSAYQEENYLVIEVDPQTFFNNYNYQVLTVQVNENLTTPTYELLLIQSGDERKDTKDVHLTLKVDVSYLTDQMETGSKFKLKLSGLNSTINFTKK